MPEPLTGGTGPAQATLAGRYDLFQRAGEGALFTVYQTRDRQTGETVALKTLKPSLARDALFASRLRAEAEAARVLDDPHTARVLAVGEENGALYIVTDFVAGSSLRERIRRTAPLPVAVAVDIATDIAEALAAAHRAGIIHGDLRPNNVLITGEGQVRVTDSGWRGPWRTARNCR